MSSTAKAKRTRKTTRAPESVAPDPVGASAERPGKSAPQRPDGEQEMKPTSKADRILALLRDPRGATLQDLVSETGWQPHTTRAALTGLRKKGHAITSKKTDGVRRYQCAAR